MAKAGYCKDCGQNVWLKEDGSCRSGHPSSSISNVYEAPSGTKLPGIELEEANEDRSVDRRKFIKVAGKVLLLGAAYEVVSVFSLAGCDSSGGDTDEEGAQTESCAEDCTESCTEDCTESCTESCTSGCTEDCTSGCIKSCTASCTIGCTESCTIGCTACTGCTKYCTGCTKSCTSGCTDFCIASCTFGCVKACTDLCTYCTGCTKYCTGCTSSCTASCTIATY